MTILLFLERNVNDHKTVKKKKMNALKITIDALLRKAETEHNSNNVEFILFFDSREIALHVNNCRVETKQIPVKIFDMLRNYLVSSLPPGSRLMLMKADAKGTRLYYENNDQKLIHEL